MVNVSIIVPVYNVEKYLDECVNSLVNQTMKDIEIILIDDGSTDKSGIMCDEYASKDERVKVMHQDNLGQSAARNRGLQTACGEYIMFVDSDDYIDIEACKTLYSIAERAGADIVNGDLLNEKKKIQYDANFRKTEHEGEAIDTKLFLMEKLNTQTYDIALCLYFIRRDFLMQNNIIFEEGYFYEDQLWTMQLLSKKGKIIKARYPFYFYRMDREGSTTNYMYLKKGTDAAHICNLMRAYIDTIPEDETKKYFYIVLLLSVFQFTQVWLRLSKEDRKNAYSCIQERTVNAALRYDFIYKELYDAVHMFWTRKRIFGFKNDFKIKIRRMLKGSNE